MRDFQTEKDLFSYVRSVVDHNTPSLKDIFAKYDWERLDINTLIQLRNNPGILLIDTRSEKEFEESHIPGALSFPVLNTYERHNVGLIYKKYSQRAAVWLAIKYADPKIPELQRFLLENNAEDKPIVIYCWRGGGRSSYLAKMLSDLGCSPSKLTGGFKAYRKLVFDFFSRPIPFRLIEISGITGTGKTLLLNAVKKDFPVIDLELSARHYSSLFGRVPYDIMHFEPVASQSAFENNIFGDVINGIDKLPHFHPHYLIESESRKVGNFQIPGTLFAGMQDCPTIRIHAPLEERIKRIVKDYFGRDLKGIPPMMEILTKNRDFFKQQLSKDIYLLLIDHLQKGQVEDFTRIMMEKYYDKKYKEKPKKPIAVIDSSSIRDARLHLLDVLKSNGYL